MPTPKWLLARSLAAIHEAQIDEHGGSHGMRDPGLLESALARPENLFAYEDSPSLTRLAASYGYGIAKNHPFVDGNKRVAWVAMRTFLSINGVILESSKAEKYEAMYAVAAGDMSEDDLVNWLDRHCRPA